jgi:hypothetical protein
MSHFKSLRSLASLALVVICLFGGYGFYRMSSGDWISSIAFGVGMMGIMFSFLRNTQPK